MQDPIATCRKLAKTAKSREIAVATETLTKVEETLTKARSRVKGLLGFERNSKPALENAIKDLEREQDRLRRLKHFGHLPCLSFKPLRWRDKNGWPRLAVMSLDSPRLQFGVVATRGDWDGRLTYKTEVVPKLPTTIQQCFEDVVAKLRAMAVKGHCSIRLTTEYAGVIPDSVRENIEKARSSFKEIFIVAEAQDWTVSKAAVPKMRPRPVDPLVVGFDGTNLWVIDSFDLTPVENYIKAEFSV